MAKKKHFEKFEGQKNIAHLLSYSSGASTACRSSYKRRVNTFKNRVILALVAFLILFIGLFGVFS
jgi:hypothetical protein